MKTCRTRHSTSGDLLGVEEDLRDPGRPWAIRGWQLCAQRVGGSGRQLLPRDQEDT